jgi:hypothetical protein
MRLLSCWLLALSAFACGSGSSPPASGADASADGAAQTDAAKEASPGGGDAGKDALPQGRDGGGPGEACTTKEECREYACLCAGERVLRAGCLPAGQCMSQAEICGGLGCTPTN